MIYQQQINLESEHDDQSECFKGSKIVDELSGLGCGGMSRSVWTACVDLGHECVTVACAFKDLLMRI